MEEVRFFAKGSIDSSTVNADNKSIMTLAAFGTKRLLDLVASFIGMVVFSPAFLIIYIAIKHEDGGSAIFKQERVGYRGKIFTLYKFRSMATTSEADGKPQLCKGANDQCASYTHWSFLARTSFR